MLLIINGVKVLPGMRLSLSRRGDSKKFNDCTITKCNPYNFILHNDPNEIGNSRSIKFGYKYSCYISDIDYWYIDSIQSKYEFKDRFRIDFSMSFMNDMIQYKILELFQLKLGVFDDYNIIKQSKNKGNIILSSTNDKYSDIEIKISRF